MTLPPFLQQATEQAAEGVPLSQLTRAAGVLSGRYRGEVQDGHWHVSDDLAARSYMVTRLPATFAAVRSAMQEVVGVRPDFAPRTLLDVGAGPGTACWAALSTWDSLEEATLLEGSAPMREWGERLGAAAPGVRLSWHSLDVRGGLERANLEEPRELVTLAYVLNELTPPQRETLLDDLWNRCADTLLLVEPGTPAGWARILEARAQLLGLGANLLAPCPHTAACPVRAPDWCHFSQRVARSRQHRQGKGAELGYEDEKFIYLAASRFAGQAYAGRVLARPAARSGLVTLKLCAASGTLENLSISKRAGERYQQAKKLDWGDALLE